MKSIFTSAFLLFGIAASNAALIVTNLAPATVLSDPSGAQGPSSSTTILLNGTSASGVTITNLIFPNVFTALGAVQTNATSTVTFAVEADTGIGGVPLVSALQAGSSVSSSLTYGGSLISAPILADTASPTARWNGGEDAYLGVRFTSGGNTHYGWVHVIWNEATPIEDSTAVIDSYAYDNTPNAPAIIPVPEPTSALMLSIFGVSMIFRRRK
jgi:hypothetical protein